ncbi:M23 family metallopeptidase [Marinihelvus fidelis]|uniref:M23 family metallopeptidase n=1 Tax=Marinihelvus fidelis TaxID=2613842 RepID=A0A5N0T6K0_9GAMM|nr:M23 family metallopeptidase [Marinihelvus fidelis]KAA9130492.1 M23 family metallopeptidase [Marinihelvus fidelis]
MIHGARIGTWAALLFAGAALAGDMYKWQDEDGLWHFSDKPPSDNGQAFDTFVTQGEPRQMITARRAGHRHEPEHYFFNRYGGDAEVELSLAEASNIIADPPLPASFVLPGQAEQPLVRLRAADPAQGFSYRLSYRAMPGPPKTDLPDDLDYYPPFARGEAYPISQGLDDDATHKDGASQYAVDIAMPLGTPILAARAGVIMDVEENYHGEGRQEAKYLTRANHVRILHDDGSMAVYAHLQANSVRVAPGMRVPTGFWIANSGNSGYSSGPHLHFVVQLNVGMALESLPFRFRLPTGGLMDPDRPQLLEGVLAGPPNPAASPASH